MPSSVRRRVSRWASAMQRRIRRRSRQSPARRGRRKSQLQQHACLRRLRKPKGSSTFDLPSSDPPSSVGTGRDLPVSPAGSGTMSWFASVRSCSWAYSATGRLICQQHTATSVIRTQTRIRSNLLPVCLWRGRGAAPARATPRCLRTRRSDSPASGGSSCTARAD